MRFLIDNQLPRALAKLLQDLGHHAVHVLDVELARVDDLAIWAYAAQHGYTIVSKDRLRCITAHYRIKIGEKWGSNKFAMLGFMLTTEIQQDSHTGPATLNPRWLRIPSPVKYSGLFSSSNLRVAAAN